MKICFVTTTIGIEGEAYEISDNFKPFNSDNYDFLLFTNMKSVTATSWEVIYLEDSYLNEKNKVNYQGNDLNILKINNIYKSRFIKFMAWSYLKKKYDIIFYCDANHYPNSNIDWDSYGKLIKKNESGILQHLHLKRRNVYQECDAAVRFGREKKENMDRLKLFLLKNNTSLNKITENTVFGYDPLNSKITTAFTKFWEVYTAIKITFRDQSLWELVKQKHQIKPLLTNMHRPITNPNNMFLKTETNQIIDKNYQNL
jgi:hypothetical protein